MIPTMILLGFALGRWWKVTLPLGAVAWPLILAVDGFQLDARLAIEAGSLALINTVIGVAVFHAFRGTYLGARRLWRSS